MKFTINNRVIKGDQNLFIIGDNADYTAEFLFDAEWNGKTKTARFIAPNGKYKDVLIKEDKCIIPVEILKAEYSKVGVYTFDDKSVQTTAKAQELIGDGFEICYVMASSIEETIEVPEILTLDGTTTLEIQPIEPSGITINYWKQI